MDESAMMEALRSLDFTRDLEPAQLQRLAAIAHEAKFSAEHAIFREGDPGELVYVIQEGQVAIDIKVPGKSRVTILTVGSGELLGWSSLFPEGRKTAGARAMTPTRAIALNAALLREIMQSDHDLGCTLLWRVAAIIAGRLKATRLQLLDIFAHEPTR